VTNVSPWTVQFRPQHKLRARSEKHHQNRITRRQKSRLFNVAESVRMRERLFSWEKGLLEEDPKNEIR